MTTKLMFLLTISFVFFKFGEPDLVMMSIYGDKGFLFHSSNLAIDNMVGFVYEDADGGFTVANCSGTADTESFKLQTDCTVLSAVGITVGTTSTTASAAEVTKIEGTSLKALPVTNFPATGVNTNMMVAKQHDAASPIVTKTKTAVVDTSAAILTITVVVGSGTTAAATVTSTFLCNNLTETSSKTFLTAVTGGSETFGQVNGVTNSQNYYPPIMKCVGAIRDNEAAASITKSAFATFILIITDHPDLTNRFNSLAFPSVVLLPKSINQTPNITTVVGYINGLDKCPTGTNFTFTASTTLPASTTSCKGKISINTKGNYSFGYNGTTYYLPVMDASGATTCPAASTTTCEDFAFNFKYSNTLIGMLLIFMVKTLQSY